MIDLSQDEKYMLRAIELAALGQGSVSPNPMVGCVIVHENQIIGEGYHKSYGGPHAEPNAIDAIYDTDKLGESTMYVTLEPCAHFGKTPPCADLLIAKNVKKVVIGAKDTNPLVGGNGIEKLKAAGIHVVTGVLEAKVREQNKRFFTYIEKQRPYVILKWAQTSDGFVAKENYDSKWISNPQSRQLVHKWRAEEDAILVGTSTANYDNPRLNVRDWEGKDPIRVVLDRSLALASTLNLFDQTQQTICYNQIKSEVMENLTYVQLNEGFSVKDVLDDLYQKKIQSILIEGGAHVLQKFIAFELWDEARVFIGKPAFGQGIAAPTLQGKTFSQTKVTTDILQIYTNN